VAINCAAIPEQLLESELFGHVRGAFTGAVADKAGLFEVAAGGTVLLDEVGDLPAALQAKLLRVVQDGVLRRVGETKERRVDVRLLAATARDLETDVRAGRFREDLFYRLNVIRLHLPPLRERPEDLPQLAAVLLARVAGRAGRPMRLAPDALGALRRHPWPGNVRELENALERAAVLSTDGTIHGTAFEPEPHEPHRGHRADGGSVGARLQEVVEQAERMAILQALEAAAGNRKAAAQSLGVSLRSLYYKLRAHGID
jgi:transcriptional regulator with PAS, ATPase and Fis domain